MSNDTNFEDKGTENYRIEHAAVKHNIFQLIGPSITVFQSVDCHPKYHNAEDFKQEWLWFLIPTIPLYTVSNITNKVFQNASESVKSKISCYWLLRRSKRIRYVLETSILSTLLKIKVQLFKKIKVNQL